MTVEDCMELVKTDTKLDIKKQDIKQAFGLSKKIVVNEQDLAQSINYTRLSYKEFQEFICRVAVLMFAETEMEDIPLFKKAEHVLEQLLFTVGLTLKK